MKKQVSIAICLLGILWNVQAQDFLSWQMNDRYFSGQVGFGFASYRGELKHNGSIQNEISNLSVGLEARLWSKVAARFELGRYGIRGNDKHAPDSSYAQQRNLSFTSANYEASLQAVFFMKKYKGDYYKRHRLDPYLFLGVGGTFISPKAKLGSTYYNLYDIKTEDESYSRFTAIIPFGAGLKWRITPFLNFNTEITYRYTFSDHLDDVSGNYPLSYPDLTTDLLSNRKDEVGVINENAYNQLVPGAARGDSSNKDSYLFLNFKFELFLPPGIFSGKAKTGIKKPSAH